MRFPFAKLGLGQRLALSYGFVVTLLIVVTAVGVDKLGVLNDTSDDALKDKYPKTVLVTQVTDDLSIIARAMRNTLIMSDHAQLDAQLTDIDAARDKMTLALEQLEHSIKDDAGKDLLAQIKIVNSAYIVNEEEFIHLVRANKIGEAKNLLLVDLNEYQDNYFNLLEKLRQSQGRLMDDASSQVAYTHLAARRLMIVVTIAAVLLSIGITWFITRSLLRQLGGEPEYAADIAKKIAIGDLTPEIALHQRDKSSLLYVMTIMRDKLAERTQALELANKELETFAYSVSHDLRSPLRAINGFTQILREDYGETLPEEAQHNLERIALASARMGTLIDALLMLSHINQQRLERRTVDLTRLSQNVVEELRESNPDRDVTVQIEPEMTAQADWDLCSVVMQNLIGNAWKYSSKVAHAEISIGTMRNDQETVFYVKDNGAGFDPQYAGRLFGAFQRLHPASEFEGTGVGLATVARVVARHGGRIWAESQPGKGACFLFTLGEQAA
ncbi:MAG: MCP four helix bundle domain-containing protein [Burkholderiales bacterium]|nr:MCP four helix bundle domain-containing protein [Burkholderiales bacterium]